MGPLRGLRVVEMAGIGPGPFAGMLLADMGAEVLRVERPAPPTPILGDPRFDLLNRGKRSVVLDLKSPVGVEAALRLCGEAEVLIEGFRPGVMERLSLGPDRCLEMNPRLVYGRITGFGQTGPLAGAAGHDLNYIALAGALHAIGGPDAPAIPLNLIGDFGGGGMLLAFGVLCALLEARVSGKGQVVDAAMIDGVSALLTPLFGLMAMGLWRDRRASNLLDGASPFYAVYRTSDDKWISLAPLEPQFSDELIERLGLDPEEFAPRFDQDQWPRLKEKLAALIRTRTRDEWCALLEGSDVCFAPVLSLLEAPEHPQLKERGTYVTVAGVRQAAPAPRFSRTPGEIRGPALPPGKGGAAALRAWGFSAEEIERLREAGALAAADP
jgi:alpha-methylacyl-CoA racemase